MAEGDVVLRSLLSRFSRYRPESILVRAGREGRIAELAGPAGAECPVYAASLDVMSQVAGFPIHRGLLAIGLRGVEPAAATLLPPMLRPSLVLGLVGLTNHDNVGACFRNAAAFGVDAAVLDRSSCDPLYRKALRVSVGTILTLPFGRVADGLGLVELLEDAGYEVFGLSPAGHHAVTDVVWPRRAALLVGSEGNGLPAGVLERCRTVRIDMAAGVDSLNVATAAAVALHSARTGLASRLAD